jgi:acetylglutamate kinase
MVYAGYINKNIVAGLQSNGINAIGLSGADANLILAHRRTSTSVDYGFVGDIDKVNHGFIEELLNKDLTLVVAPITHNGQGQLLNTNADTIAQTLATSLAEKFSVELIYGFEKAGVLTDMENDASVIPVLNPALYQSYKKENKIFAGMIPKLDNAFSALDAGVQKVIIGKAEELDTLITGSGGTSICHD